MHILMDLLSSDCNFSQITRLTALTKALAERSACVFWFRFLETLFLSLQFNQEIIPTKNKENIEQKEKFCSDEQRQFELKKQKVLLCMSATEFEESCLSFITLTSFQCFLDFSKV